MIDLQHNCKWHAYSFTININIRPYNQSQMDLDEEKLPNLPFMGLKNGSNLKSNLTG